MVSELKFVPCRNCKELTFEGDLQCRECKLIDQPDIVTGYRIIKPVQCKICNSKADEESWNAFVSVYKQCAWCGETQGPSYSKKK